MTKKIIILFLVTVLLATLVFIIRKNPANGTKDKYFFSNILVGDVTTIDIDYFIQGITLQKNDTGIWMLSSRKTKLSELLEKEGKAPPESNNQSGPANQDFVNQTLTTLLGVTQETLVSTNVEKQGLFELTDAALSVTLTTKTGMTKKLFIGKDGPSPYTTYVRGADTSEVYLVSESLAGLINRPFDEWKQEEKKTPTK